MDLQNPSTLLAAWILVPAVIVLAAGGLGGLVARVTDVPFGALTLPVGFLSGIVLMTGLLELGASGTFAVVTTAVLAATGAVVGLWPTRRRLLSRDFAAPAAGAAAAYFLALLPLAGSGRLGVLGYILNNDSFVHSTLVDLMRENGAQAPSDAFTSSYDSVGSLFESGYPLGSHVWPLFGTLSTGVEPFHLWSPAIAVGAAMLALVAYACLRRLAMSKFTAAAAAALVPCGYLFYSFMVQGSAKEPVTAVAVYGSIAIAAHVVLDNPSWRALPAVAIGPGAALLTFGAGAASWIAPALVGFVIIAVWRFRQARPPRGILVAAGVACVGLVVLAVPLVREALDYVRTAEETLRDPVQIGNLLGAVPWEEAFNLWFAYDYRIQPPVWEGLSSAGPWVGGAFAVLGLVYSLAKRDLVLPFMVLAGVVAAIVISDRYTIYLDAKSYAILAPALGIAAAAGVAALLAGSRVVHALGVVAGIVLAIGVLGGVAFVYRGVWVSPNDRFEELAAIADRFEGQGPILVNEREEWDSYLLRELDPVESWGFWFPERGLHIGEPHPHVLPHTPDFDDYRAEHVRQFPLLLERKRPGGSRPPSNYRIVHETATYRIWQESGPPPEHHLALGRPTLDNAGRLKCRKAKVRDFFRTARRADGEVVASVPRARTQVVADPSDWVAWAARVELPPPGQINRRDGVAASRARLERGTYSAWIQGSFGPGVRLFVDGQAYGEVFGDLALPSAWHSLGDVRSNGDPLDVRVLPLDKPWWQSGSQRSDLTGSVVFEPAGAEPALRRFEPRELQSLCGERLDWLELVGG